jgi:hypothetical protein
MTKYKVPFYFVLYLVVLVELLLVIIERDSTELELKTRLAEYATIQDSVISLYSQPILLNVDEETEWLISQRDSVQVTVSVSNLQTPEEKAKVRYFVNTVEENDASSYNVITDINTGNGAFYFKTNKNGTYNFDVYCKLQRQLPRYLPKVILDGIYEKVGTNFQASSDTVNFRIKAKHKQQSFDRPGRG